MVDLHVIITDSSIHYLGKTDETFNTLLGCNIIICKTDKTILFVNLIRQIYIDAKQFRINDRLSLLV